MFYLLELLRNHSETRKQTNPSYIQKNILWRTHRTMMFILHRTFWEARYTWLFNEEPLSVSFPFFLLLSHSNIIKWDGFIPQKKRIALPFIILNTPEKESIFNSSVVFVEFYSMNLKSKISSPEILTFFWHHFKYKIPIKLNFQYKIPIKLNFQYEIERNLIGISS